MARPRLLIIPEFTELEWTIIPRLEEWAEVASYDSPGVGAESVSNEELERVIADASYRRERIAQRGIEEAERRGWDWYILAADSGANLVAWRIAGMRPQAVAGIALGHACLSLDREGARAPINREVATAMANLVDQDREQFIRHAMTQLTGGSYDEDLAARIVERVPIQLLSRAWLAESDEPAEEPIAGLDRPLLLVKHENCLLYTDEGFDDAVAAFPGAQTGSVTDKPSVSDDFAELLREFCTSIEATR